MAKSKIVQTPKPFRVESGDDIGIALQTLYEAVAPNDAGYDLFNEEQLTKARADFIVRETHRFEFTIVPHPIGGYWQIFAEQK